MRTKRTAPLYPFAVRKPLRHESIPRVIRIRIIFGTLKRLGGGHLENILRRLRLKQRGKRPRPVGGTATTRALTGVSNSSCAAPASCRDRKGPPPVGGAYVDGLRLKKRFDAGGVEK